MKRVVAVLAATLSLSGCATDIGYLLKQGGYLISYSSGARDIQSVLRDEHTPVATREFLSRVQDIRDFAVRRIGLASNGSYTRYREIPRDYIADVVQASDAVSFTPYLWSYPVLGRLPYKGFYERADAEAEADRLKKLGFDTIVRHVDSFSTLGVLRDPVYSFMRRYSLFELASLIIHEQTHATVFLKGQPEFNEELATFVGDQGAFWYLRERYGPASKEHADAVAAQADSQLFLGFVRELRRALEAVYGSRLSREEKLARKREVIDTFLDRYKREYVPRFRTKGYHSARRIPLNNAYISLYDLYTGNLPVLERYYAQACSADLRLFVSRVKDLARSPGDVREKMRVRQGG